MLLFAVVLSAAGVASGIQASRIASDAASSSPVVLLTFVGILTVAGFLKLNFRFRDEVNAFDLFEPVRGQLLLDHAEAVLTPAVFVLSGVGVVFAVAVSVAVSEAIMRVKPVKALFNIAQLVSAAGAGALVLAALRGPSQHGARDLLALCLAMAVMMAVTWASPMERMTSARSPSMRMLTTFPES